MKLTYAALCLCLVLGTGFSLVSAKNAAANDAAPLLAQPTEAPLLMSTAKPTLAPKKAPSPTKAMVMNVPPKMPHKPAEEQTENKMEMKKEQPPKKTTAVKSASSNSKQQAADGKPVPVSGFITRNGNIFEIEGEDGIGLIESRQNPSEDTESSNVCNYGSVVIYSDVPCDEVTNVHVSDVKETQIKEGSELGEPAQQEGGQSPASPAAPANDLPHDATALQALEDVEIEEELYELEKEQRRRRKQNRRRQANRNGGNSNRAQLQGNGNRRRSNKNRGQGGSQRGGGQQQQLTRRQQQNRRRHQQQNRNRQQNRRRQQSNSYSNSNRNRNRNRNRDRDEVDDREQEYHRGRGV